MVFGLKQAPKLIIREGDAERNTEDSTPANFRGRFLLLTLSQSNEPCPRLKFSSTDKRFLCQTAHSESILISVLHVPADVHVHSIVPHDRIDRNSPNALRAQSKHVSSMNKISLSEKLSLTSFSLPFYSNLLPCHSPLSQKNHQPIPTLFLSA